MSQPKQMVQCRLERAEDENSLQVMVAWIEERAAQVGASVELLPSGQFWTVAAVYNRIPAFALAETQRQRRQGLPSLRDTAKDKRQREQA